METTLTMTKTSGYCYRVAGHPRLLVMRHRHYVNDRANRFRGYVTTYVATARQDSGELVDVAQGHLLADLRRRLEMYVCDVAANNVGTRHLYGFFGIRSPARRVEV